MAAADVYLIRHAESEWNAVGRWQGRADVPLSAHGRAQAQALGAVIAGWTGHAAQPVTHLFTSPQLRSAQTAAALARPLGLEPVADDDLMELDVGSWQGRSRAEIGAEDPAALDLFYQGRKGWEGGETYAQHEARAAAFAARLDGLGEGSRAVVVTHGGTLRGVILALLGLDWRLGGSANTAITHLRRGPHGWRLISYNVAIGASEPPGAQSDLGGGEPARVRDGAGEVL